MRSNWEIPLWLGEEALRLGHSLFIASWAQEWDDAADIHARLAELEAENPDGGLANWEQLENEGYDTSLLIQGGMPGPPAGGLASKIGTRRLPNTGTPWPKYQRHVTQRDYEEVWTLSHRQMGVDGRRQGLLIEAKWAGKNSSAWKRSPYHPESRYYDEGKILDQARRYLELNTEIDGAGVRYAISNSEAANHFRRLFAREFPDAVDSGTLSVWHVPGTGMR